MKALERVLEAYGSGGHRHAPESAGLGSLAREQALQQLRDGGLPDADCEHWRYANLRALDRVRSFLPATSDAAPDASTLPPPVPGFERLVFVDGRRCAELSSPRMASLLTVTRPPVAVAPGTDRPDDADARFALLATLFGSDRACLQAPAAVAIELIYVSTGLPGSVYPRLSVELAPEQRLALIERHVGAPADDGMVCTQVQIDLQRGAELLHYRLQDCRTNALILDTVAPRLAVDAHYRVRQIAVGSATSRSSVLTELAGDRARFSWHGLAVINDRQVSDFLVRSRHLARDTGTEQRFRGIAGDQARIGFNADVQVEAAGAGSKVSQSLRGLIDGKGASINLRPRLTINTDAIQASHGATTGQLDDNLLFYLLSRGLEPATARALLKWAFLGDVLATIDIASLRREAERAVAGHLTDQLAASVLS